LEISTSKRPNRVTASRTIAAAASGSARSASVIAAVAPDARASAATRDRPAQFRRDHDVVFDGIAMQRVADEDPARQRIRFRQRAAVMRHGRLAQQNVDFRLRLIGHGTPNNPFSA
jgi:hypothetical protein